MNRLLARDDDGSVLVMALVFLSLFGLAIAASLSFAETGFRTAGTVHGTTETQYAAEAGVEGAINAIRGDVSAGKAGYDTACFSYDGDVNNATVSVRCTGRPGSGASTGGAGGGAVPANNVLALNAPANSASEGVVLSASAATVVSGHVVTNESVVAPAGSSLTVQGSLTCKAVTGPGTLTATTTDCPAVVAPTAADPAYPAEISVAPAAVTVPACAGGATVTFAPGTYQSAAALSALMDGSCPSTRFHFSPGTYYFDFGTATATTEWLISDPTAEVVGGTLTAAVFPDACDLASAGVQFVFGAASRLALTDGTLELCPPLVAGQRIAIHGVPANTAAAPPISTTVVATTATTTGTTAPPATATGFVNPADGAVFNGAEAVFTARGQGGAATLTVTGFSTSAVPANASVLSAELQVASRIQHVGTVNVGATAGDGSTATYPLTPCDLTVCGAGTVATIDVSALINSPARANGISVTYTARDTPGGGSNFFTARVDGIRLSVTYTMPGLTATSACATAAPYSPSVATTCAVLRGTGGASARMAVKGTIYAPLAAVDLSLTGQLNALTQRGIVARTLYLGSAPGAAYGGALLSMPGSLDRQVLFTASVGGSEQLRAEVTFADGLGATPGVSVDVSRWSVLR